MNKNDVCQIVIEDMGENGEGIGKINGYTLFVKDGVIGDTLEVKVMKTKKNYGYGKLLSIITPSPFRVTPVCPVASPCGGCQLQALDYSRQLTFKENKVRNHLTRIGGFKTLPMEPIVGMEEPYHYRNKAQYPVGRGKDGTIITGFYAGHTHSIVGHSDCCIGDPVNRQVLTQVKQYMQQCQVEPYDEVEHQGLIRHILIRVSHATKDVLVCLVINGTSLPDCEYLVQRLRQVEGMTSICYSVNTKKTNVILGDKVKSLFGPPYITDQIGSMTYQISAKSFYQVNPVQTEKLYRLVLEYANLTGEEVVWDLYCGIGTISLFLAQNAKQVYGVEIVPEAVENARANAKRNHLENIIFMEGKAEEILPEKREKEGIVADVVTLDPPRKGCEARLLQTILDIAPSRIVYVSCDSATLARDLRILCESQYTLTKVRPVDMFAQTVGVETVALLTKI